jgi:hypothetical protein
MCSLGNPRSREGRLGRVLGSSADKLAQQRSAAAVTEALVPVCIGQSQADPERGAKLAQLKALSSSYQQSDFIMETGWATVPTADAPNRELAEACASVLLKPAQS